MRRAPVLALLLFALPAHAQDESDPIRHAAKLRGEWQFEAARDAIDDLARRLPDDSVVRYLQAEMAFLEGNYSAALALLPPDPEGQFAVLRELLEGTSRATEGFLERVSDGGHFRIAYAPGKDEVIVDLTGDVLEQAYALLEKNLGYAPPSPVRVEILRQPSDLARVSTLSEQDIDNTGTIALCKYNKLMVVTPRTTLFGYPWMDTMVHEYVHYVVSRHTLDHTPVWLHEGLARFLQTAWRQDPADSLSVGEASLLANALKNNKLITFDAMHPSMAKLPDRGSAALAFAEVYTLLLYVHKKVGYQGFRDILARLRNGENAKDAVGATLNTTFEQVERDWKRYLASLKLRASKQSVTGREHIRFRKGKGDDENVGVDEVASEEARRFTRLGGIFRSRGLTQAAAIEYEKALAITPSEPFVIAKLSRTYLELDEAEKAAELVAPLVASDERNASAATTLGRALLKLKRFDEAQNALEQALRVSPFDPTVRCGLAEVYTALTDRRENRERVACDKLR